jgi:CspA family cold shock protein
MATGTVKWFDRKKGFGFILNDQGQDVFAHFSTIEGEGFRYLKEGETVTFEPATGANGLYASKVVRTTEKAPARKPRQSTQSAVSVA